MGFLVTYEHHFTRCFVITRLYRLAQTQNCSLALLKWSKHFAQQNSARFATRRKKNYLAKLLIYVFAFLCAQVQTASTETIRFCVSNCLAESVRM